MATKTITEDRLGPIGTLLSAALVASCCLGPVLFLLFGASIGALGALVALEPYRPYFITAGLGFWGYGFHRLYLRQPATGGVECTTGSCERPSSGARALLWIALAVLLLAITYPGLAVRWFGWR
jgi:mercuric ion transport protein